MGNYGQAAIVTGLAAAGAVAAVQVYHVAPVLAAQVTVAIGVLSFITTFLSGLSLTGILSSVFGFTSNVALDYIQVAPTVQMLL